MLNVIIAISMFVPNIYGKIIDNDYQLKGVLENEGEVPVDFYSFWTGASQSALEDEMLSDFICITKQTLDTEEGL